MGPKIAAAIGRLYPFLSGNFTLVNYSKVSRLFPYLDELKWCASPGGQILVPLSDAVGRCIYYTGDYDRKITRLCQTILRPGDVAIDIGANLGVVSLTMANVVGPQGHVHAFEPNPALHSLLAQSLNKENITTHRVGLGPLTDEMTLYVPMENLGAASLVHMNGMPIQCYIRALDDIIEEEKIDRVSLVKIDVEGFEAEVLAGARLLLEVLRPAIIMETNTKDNAAHNLLLQKDYVVRSISKTMFSVRLSSTVDSHDILAIPQENAKLFAQIGSLG